MSKKKGRPKKEISKDYRLNVRLSIGDASTLKYISEQTGKKCVRNRERWYQIGVPKTYEMGLIVRTKNSKNELLYVQKIRSG